MKRCTRCQEMKPLDQFRHYNRTNGRKQYREMCLPCERNKSREWRLANPEKAKARDHRTNHAPGRPATRRRAYLKETYRLTVAEYNALLIGQGERCAICGSHHSVFDRTLSVDHCHDTGKIRGLLCNNCNNGLGRFKHDPDLLKAARAYLIY